MKTFFISLLLLVCLNSSKTFAQTTYKFIIDQKTYIVEESKLNDLFGMALNELLQTKTAKQSSYDLWLNSYQTFKTMSLEGTRSWDVYYDKIANSKYSNNSPLVGLNQFSDADMGMSKGKMAEGNPNKKQNHGARMALLNYLILKYITNAYTSKTVK